MTTGCQLVEVYDAAQRCYMPGQLEDIDKTKVLVQFQMADGKKAGQPKWFEWGVVREVPPQASGPFQEGQSVEVSYTDEGNQEPAAWWEAKIVSRKGVLSLLSLVLHFFSTLSLAALKVHSTKSTSCAGPSPTR